MEADQSFDQALSSAKKAEPEAIDWFWRRHQPALRGWLCSFDAGIADDVSSEAWLEVLRALDRFDGDEKHFRSWLFTIARHRLIDRQRRENRRRDIISGNYSDVPQPYDTNAAAFSDIESRQAIKQITESLAPDQAEVLLLRVVAGLDVETVAQITGKTEGAVRVLQHRALRKLARSMKPDTEKEIFEEGVTQ